MGVSTDGILFYGFCWDEEGRLSEEAGELWGKDEPVLVGHHGSDEWSVPYVYIQASEIEAARGYPKEVTLDCTQPQPDWDDKLREFCERFDIKPPQDKPRWWLVSWWG